MSHSDTVILAGQGSPSTGCSIIWLGGHSPLLEATWPLAEVYHVASPKTLLGALQRQLSTCVVLDLAWFKADLAPLLRQIRDHAPHAGVLALVPAEGERPDATHPDIDRVLPVTASQQELSAALKDLATETARRLAAPGPRPHSAAQDIPDKLNERLRHLEGLVQASFTIGRTADEGDILGDLHSVARIAVDADDIAVLLTDAQYTDLSDALDLGVPGTFLDVCRAYLAACSAEERPIYLGDEVLLRERQPDVQPNAPRVREAEAAGALSYMRLPLTIDQQLIGFVALFSNQPNQFNGAHLQLGRLFASQVSTAVRNMRLYLRLNRAEQRQQAVGKVARLIAEDMTLSAVLSRIVEEAVQLVAAQTGVLLLVQPDSSLSVSAAHHLNTQHTRAIGSRLNPDEGQAGLIARTGKPGVVTNYRQWEHARPEMKTSLPENATLYGVPLHYRRRVLGVLQVVKTNANQDEIQDDLDVLMMLAPQAATAIAKAQLHETIQQDRQQLRAILDNTAAGVAVCDASGRVLMLNPEAQAVLKRLNIKLKDVIDQRIMDLLRKWVPDRQITLDQPDAVLDVNLGDIGEYLVRIAPITKSDGTIDRYVAVAQDVSELRRLDRLKSDMIHILSHDLRNPLGLARGSIDLIDEPDIPPDQREQLRGMIINSLDRMEQLIQDVVDLEMAQSLGEESAKPYRLSSLVREVVERNEDKARQHAITLSYQEISAPVHLLLGHSVLVGQAIDNLLSNAVKYTPAGGKIDVTLAIADDYAVIEVKDTGYGMPPESLPHVFDQFFRVQDRRTRHIQGTGLGLSLVKTIAQAHGGYVSVDSVVDQGSTFKLFLPLSLRKTAKAPAQSSIRLDLSDLAKKDRPH